MEISVNTYTYMYIFIHTCTYIYIYIYIHIFQAETYPIPEALVMEIAAVFASAALQRSVLMLATMFGEGGGFTHGAHLSQFVPDTSHRLKIGYISSDFKQHPLSYLINNLFLFHDNMRFEIFCYASTPRSVGNENRDIF